jgi:DNA (cytosine-5)-methyltransferase 1
VRSIELFAGAGGMAMGVSIAGFSHEAVLEWDKHCCATIQENKVRGVAPATNWPLHKVDIRQFDYSNIRKGLELIAGGPPCQPFSLGGKCLGPDDPRDMFPQAIRAVREVRPRAFVLENVKGLLRECFTTYLDYLRLQLTYPHIRRKENEDWKRHLSRLERHFTSGSHDDQYRILIRPINTADYGIPQRRERVIIVGIRADLGVEWAFPRSTHSETGLLKSKWITNDYWERHRIPRKQRESVPARMRRRVDALRLGLIDDSREPWVTVRDAISDLPNPRNSSRARDVLNHGYIAGARSYTGHTGSPLDEPAKALKAGDHGVPGGENMLVETNGRVRYFTVRESARLQTFPDNYVFIGAWTEVMRQLGNAVPVKLSTLLAGSIKVLLKSVLHNESR